MEEYAYESRGEFPTPPQKDIITERQIQNQMIQEERVSNFISQTSPTTSLDKLNLILRGYNYDSIRGEWIQKEQGIPENIRRDIIQFITPDLSEDTRMTNLDVKQINGIMESVIDFMTWYLYATEEKVKENGKERDLTLVELDKIFWIVVKAVFITITRSYRGVERNRMYGALDLSGNITPEQNKEKTEWWKFWK